MEREVNLWLRIDLTFVQTGVLLAGVGEVKTPGVARPLKNNEDSMVFRDKKLLLLRLRPDGYGYYFYSDTQPGAMIKVLFFAKKTL